MMGFKENTDMGTHHNRHSEPNASAFIKLIDSNSVEQQGQHSVCERVQTREMLGT